MSERAKTWPRLRRDLRCIGSWYVIDLAIKFLPAKTAKIRVALLMAQLDLLHLMGEGSEPDPQIEKLRALSIHLQDGNRQ